MDEQKKILDELFETWKGDLEQLDDFVLLVFEYNVLI
jgi:hypothetical protein